MGQKACECYDNSQLIELRNLKIKIQEFNFKKIQDFQDLFQTICKLSNGEIEIQKQNLKCYKKNQNTYFIGQIEDKFAHNFGIIYIPQKTLYYGNFHHGYIQGQGVLKFLQKHLLYKGQFHEGAPHGNGKLINQKQEFTFQGLWKKNKIHNYSLPHEGILQLNNDKHLKSIQFQSFQHKLATISYKNGNLYKGFIDNVKLIPNGSGKMQFKSGDSYEGQWLDGKFHGYGNYIWENGQIYKGQYLTGQKNGQGTLYYISGQCFKGIWKNGKRQNFGKIINEKGFVIQKGFYNNDKIDLQKTKLYLQGQMQKAIINQVKSQLLQIENIEIKIEQNNKLKNI